jgi:hypothetical protein
MARARGANAVMALAFESEYGTPPSSGFYKVPFVSSQLGDKQDLVSSDLLGDGRDPSAPALDVINNEGDVVVPVDLRNFGFWLKLLCGAPTTTAGLAATGSIAFSAQPAASSTITVGGVEFTFVASDAGDSDILIGSSLADTVANAVLVLNASTDADVAAAGYAVDAKGKAIDIVHDTIGVAGNSFTLAASGATVSGATLAGGAASGAYNHVFKSGADPLPSAAVEIGNTDVSTYAMNYGVVADKLAINLQRSGLLNATISCIAQGEDDRTKASAAGTLSALELERFTQFTGKVLRSGVPLGDLVSGSLTYANNYDKVEIIREDGRIGGADPAVASYSGQAVLRFKDTTLMDLASDGTPIDLSYSWKIGGGKALTFIFHEVYLPKPKVPVTGPGAVQATYDWQGAKNSTVGRAATITLVNDVATY